MFHKATKLNIKYNRKNYRLIVELLQKFLNSMYRKE